MKNTDPTKVSASLPMFPGFYNSILDHAIDSEIASEQCETGEEYDAIMERYDMGDAMKAISKDWSWAYARRTGISMEFEEVTSPKEYNFTTDRCFVLIPVDEIERVAKEVDETVLRKVLKDMFTSYDGFMSFYSNSLEHEEWQAPVSEWDHNQLQALLLAHLLTTDPDITRDELEMEMYEASYEGAYAGWIKDRPEVLAA